MAGQAEAELQRSTILFIPFSAPPHKLETDWATSCAEVGITKSFFGNARLDANVFRRDFRNYSDDDVLLDTGVSFPISFAKGQITGEEVRIEVPHWGRFSAYLSYANQVGTGQGPITGGLFLGSDAAAALTGTSRFAVTQDQRNTAVNGCHRRPEQ